MGPAIESMIFHRLFKGNPKKIFIVQLSSYIIIQTMAFCILCFIIGLNKKKYYYVIISYAAILTVCEGCCKISNIHHTSSYGFLYPGIVEDVYAAQRKRDEATSSRLRLANEERDEFFERLRRLEARLDAQR